MAELTTLCICPHGDERHTIVRGPLRYCDSPFCGCFTDSAPTDTDPVGRPGHRQDDQQWPETALGDDQ